MLLTEYNEKLHNKTLRAEGREEGREEGIEEGISIFICYTLEQGLPENKILRKFI